MIIENVNDILSILTLALVIIIPMYFIVVKIATYWSAFNEQRIQNLMKEDDWHM